MRVLGQDSRLSTVLADRFFLAEAGASSFRCLARFSSILDHVYACAAKHARILVHATPRAYVCVCVYIYARAFVCLQWGANSRAHSLPIRLSLTFPPLYAYVLRSLFFPLVAHASSHSQSGRSLSHSHPFTLDLKMRPIHCPKLFFSSTVRRSSNEIIRRGQRREIESISEGRRAKVPWLSHLSKTSPFTAYFWIIYSFIYFYKIFSK